MAEAVIGTSFTFQVLFVDGTNASVDVTDPTIDIFSFSATGVKQPLLTGQPMDDAVPAETGRYTYAYTIPSAFTDGDTLYAEVTGYHGLNLMRAFVEVSVISVNRGLGASVGMTASFWATGGYH